MKNSFPPEEMRSHQGQLDLLGIAEYAIDTVNEEGVIVGFLATWNLEHCVFIEHIAIDPEKRSKQYGKKLLDMLMDMTDKPIVLEIEMPQDELTKRRVGFYERNNFKLCYFDYWMPPLREGFEPMQMMIMSYPEELTARDFEPICTEIYRKVYNTTDPI